MDPRDAVRIADFEPVAREALTPAAFDYIAGGAWDEITLAENEAAWRRRRLRPRVLVDVSVDRPGDDAARPPRGHAGGHRPDGRPRPRPPGRRARDRAGRRRGRGAVHVVDDVDAGRSRRSPPRPPTATRWFQLYTQADAVAGPDRSSSAPPPPATGAIVLTVDLPRLGYRERDRRSGFDLPDRTATSWTGRPTHAAGQHASGFGELEDQPAPA